MVGLINGYCHGNLGVCVCVLFLKKTHSGLSTVKVNNLCSLLYFKHILNKARHCNKVRAR